MNNATKIKMVVMTGLLLVSSVACDNGDKKVVDSVVDTGLTAVNDGVMYVTSPEFYEVGPDAPARDLANGIGDALTTAGSAYQGAAVDIQTAVYCDTKANSLEDGIGGDTCD